MADNVAITVGSGTTIAADEVSDGTLGSCKVQYIKIMDGTLDGTSKAAVGANGLACDVKAAVISSGTITTVSAVTAITNALPAGSNVIGHVIADTGSTTAVTGNVTVVQSTASSLNATVVGTGTFATQATCTNSGTFAVQSTDSINSKTILSIKAAYTASQTAATVLTPTSGKKFVVTDIVISATGAGTVYLFDHTDGATAALTPTLSLAANGGFVNAFKGLYTATAANNLIKYTSGSGAAGSIMVYYYEI